MDFQEIAKEVLELEAKELLKVDTTKIDFQGIVETILNSSGKLIVMGVGKSGLIGQKIAATLASTGTPSFFIHPTEAMHGDLGMIEKKDIILAISYSGESDELIAILPHLKRLSHKIITMSKNPHSSLSKEGDFFIPINIAKEACPINTAPTSSTTLTLALGDALAACLMKARNFTTHNFASFHPGGSLGKKLFVKIKDLMQKENLPIISPEIPLKDAIIKMSEARLGSAILAQNNQLYGVLSDGDLRRAMMAKDFSLESPVKSYATLNPKFCDNENMLAQQALEFIEQNKIQLLIITDSTKNIKGVVHLHTLISAGIRNS
ncbi:KpsF/GutQ family sugar-phosphate isomerase [Helicobacter sp. faydin-H20]|uniref:KpsF/GutQ family sugar-phosphate isomerase n=1 Tax=Helicobacter anatolicus TaxID=2905874 RepID=UPI001E3B7EE3|nr:KpsF/GutQ family sugar-phosphate isomerase [Helicobacter anatolicus]MCE3037073.1 KpsF/GutQ family sugar-phosphate isomerase [Helicobacter anatolicus]